MATRPSGCTADVLAGGSPVRHRARIPMPSPMPDLQHLELGRDELQLFFDFGEEDLAGPTFSSSLRVVPETFAHQWPGKAALTTQGATWRWRLQATVLAECRSRLPSRLHQRAGAGWRVFTAGRQRLRPAYSAAALQTARYEITPRDAIVFGKEGFVERQLLLKISNHHQQLSSGKAAEFGQWGEVFRRYFHGF